MSANISEIGTYRTDIDGLRAIAVLSVILFHAHIAGFSGGFVGVDVFFVISGYLIGAIVYREVRERRFSFAKFYARRAKRILPALFFMLLCLYALTALVLTPSELINFGNNALATVLAVSNIVLWRGADYFAPSAETNPLLMTWSLGVEEQFYLIFPVLLIVLHRFKAPVFVSLVALCIGSLVLCIKLTASHPSAAFYMLPARAWELGLGTLLAVADVRLSRFLTPRSLLTHALSITGLASIVTAVIFFDSDMPFPGYTALLPTLGAAALIASNNGIMNRWLLSRRSLVFLGLVSYSWYLWHWPMLSLARVIANRTLSNQVSFIIAACSLIPAVLSWRFVERPFRTSSMAVRPLLWSYATAVIALLLPAAIIIAGAGWPARFSPAVARVEQAVQEEQSDPCLRAYGVTQPNWSPRCAPSSASTEAIALLGDSHAAALAPGLRAQAKSERLGFFELTKSSCPTLAGVSRFMPNHLGHDRECADFSAQALGFVVKNADIKVVFLAGYWSAPFVGADAGHRFVRDGDNGWQVSALQSAANLRYGLQQTVQLLQAAGKRVMIFKDTPRFNFDPAHEVQTTFIPTRRWLMRRLVSTEVPYHDVAARAALVNDESVVDGVLKEIKLQYPQVVVIDPWTTLCSQAGCRFADANAVYYADNQHLSAVGAEYALSGRQFSSYLMARAAH